MTTTDVTTQLCVQHLSSTGTSQTGPHGQPTMSLHTGRHCPSQVTTKLIAMPPGHQSGAHLHQDHEVQLLVLCGAAITLYGPALTPLFHTPGDVVHIPPGVIHAGLNLSRHPRETVYGYEVLTDPADQDIIPLPELDERIQQIDAELRTCHSDYAALHGPMNAIPPRGTDHAQ